MTVSDQLSEPTITDCKCLWCGRSMKYASSFREMFYIDDVICRKCRRQLPAERQVLRTAGLRIEGQYVYEGMIREMLLQYKENCDEALFPVFLYPFVKQLKNRYRGYSVVPVPSSREMMVKRGFRHVNKIFSLLELSVYDLIEKTDNVEQKKSLSRTEIGEHFRIRDEKPLPKGRILLVDDIVTTGASMASCYRLLEKNYAEIKCMTVAYNRRFSHKVFMFTKK